MDTDNQTPEELIKCNCGTPARKHAVQKEGPNTGRHFYNCPSNPKKCKYFAWVADPDHPDTESSLRSTYSRPSATIPVSAGTARLRASLRDLKKTHKARGTVLDSISTVIEACTAAEYEEPIQVMINTAKRDQNPTSVYFQEGTDYVYVLALEGGNYYVGTTANFAQRMAQHFSGEGAAWTKRHRPIHVFTVQGGDGLSGTTRHHGVDEVPKLCLGTGSMEDLITLRTMATYGVEHVRGGSWCDVELLENPLLPGSTTSTTCDPLAIEHADV